jgi:hypothetical protein
MAFATGSSFLHAIALCKWAVVSGTDSSGYGLTNIDPAAFFRKAATASGITEPTMETIRQ